jgi:hypothetical protein
MSEEINHNRRRFLGATAVTIAAARFGLIGSADAQSDKTNTAKAPPIRPETSASFGALKQIDSRRLERRVRRGRPRRQPGRSHARRAPRRRHAQARNNADWCRRLR